MPDLTNDPIGANYRRAEQRFSNFGTRRLRFYTIEVTGYDIFDNEDTDDSDSRYDWNFETTGVNGDDGYYGYKNQPKSIIEAILRGVSLVAETYYVSWWSTDYDGDLPLLYITVAVAGDTFLDGMNQQLQTNSNAYSLNQAVADALGSDFSWQDIYVWAREISGENLTYATNGPPFALTREKVQLSDAAKAERQARLAGPNVNKVSRRK